MYMGAIDTPFKFNVRMIDDGLNMSPEYISERTDGELIALLRWWQHEGNQVFKEIHRQYQKPDSKSSVVYFALRSDGLTKIGYTTNPKQRYQRLAEKHGERLEILQEIKSEDPFPLEQQIHEELANYHVLGEWFDLPIHILEKTVRIFNDA